jgi:hypothetical protein
MALLVVVTASAFHPSGAGEVLEERDEQGTQESHWTAPYSMNEGV